MINKIGALLIVAFSIFNTALAEDCFPDKMDGVNLVYDETNSLSAPEQKQLNDFLINVSNQTSNQIVVAIVGDICGMDGAMYATELGQKWGVGRKGEDNGIVILVKPTKTNGPRTTFIAVGYGLEGVIPDATAKLIVENEMNPRFKSGQIYEGLVAGLQVIVPLVKQEFNYVAYQQQKGKKSRGVPYIFIIVIGVVILSKIFGARSYANQNGISIWSALFMGSMIGSSFGGSGRSGGYNNFSSGGGGFGGFGGGGFGGGGAGGDW